MKNNINEKIYELGAGKISNVMNKPLHQVLDPTAALFYHVL